MKLTIPDKCQIGSQCFRIRMNDRFLEAAELQGQSLNKQELIRLSHRSLEAMFTVMIHEALHQIVPAYGINPSEQDVSTIAIGLAIFLLSLGIEPDFSQVPKEEQ